MFRKVLYILPLAVAFAQSPAPKPAAKPVTAAKPATPAKPAAAVKPAAAPAPAIAKPAAADDSIVLTVGTEKITRTQFEEFINGLPEQVQVQARGPAKRQLAEQIAELKTMAQEARKRKIDQTPAMKQQIAIQIDKTLASALYQELMNSAKTDDAALRAAFEKDKGKYEQVKARHILIRFQGSRVPLKPEQKDLTEAESLAKTQELHKRILAGEDFAAVAKAESDDTGSGANGGDLGSFSRGQMVGVFEDTAFALPVGKVSEPVKTPFGYHLIKVEEHSSKKFEEVRPELEQQMKPEQAKEAIEALKKTTTVVIDDKYFGPAAPPTPLTPPAPAPGQEK